MKFAKLLFLLPVMAFGQFSNSTFQDTVLITRLTGVTTQYTSGDVVRSVSTALYGVNVSRTTSDGPGRGYITSVQIAADTANVTGASFTVRFFNFTDTTGKNAAIAVDNAVYQGSWLNSAYRVGDADISLSMDGTTGGGSTVASGIATNLNIPYVVGKGKLWILLIAKGSYTPKHGGLIRIKVSTERTY